MLKIQRIVSKIIIVCILVAIPSVVTTKVYASSDCAMSCAGGNTCPGACDVPTDGTYCSKDAPSGTCLAPNSWCNCWQWCCLVCKPGDCGTTIPEPPCEAGTPTNPTAVSPSGDIGLAINPIVFTWDAPSDWKKNCSGSHSYHLYVNGAEIANPTTETYSWSPLQCTQTYSWYVVADNGSNKSGNSNTLSFNRTNVAPTASITSVIPAKIYDNGSLTVTAVGNDSNRNLNSMELWRRLGPSGTWYGLTTGTTTRDRDDSFGPTTTHTMSRTWNLTCADVGTWQLAVNTFDTCSLACSGNPDCNPAAPYGVCPSFPTWNDCGPGDSATVTVAPMYTMTLKVNLMGDGNPENVCPTFNYSAPGMSGVSVALNTTNPAVPFTFIGVTDASGKVTVPNIPAELTQLDLTLNYSNNAYCNNGYAFACEDTTGYTNTLLQRRITIGTLAQDPSTKCYSISKNIALREIPANSWYTSVDGNIFSQNLADITCPLLAATYSPQFSGSYINRGVDTFPFGFYVLSDGSIDTSGAPIIESNAGGWAKNLGVSSPALTYKDAWFSKYVLKGVPHGLVTPLGNINGVVFDYVNHSGGNFGLYQTTPEIFNAWASTNAVHTYKVTGPADNSGGLAILYVTGGSTHIVIGGPVQADSNAPYTWGRLLIVTDKDIEILPGFGTSLSPGNPAPLGTADIQLGMLTTGNITFRSINESENPKFTKDIPLLNIGPIISQKTIAFGRDLLLDNKYSPAHIVRYNSSFIYKLTQSERSHATFGQYTGVSTFDTQWFYSQ